MSGETLNYKKHLSLRVGQYCQVHEDDTPRNSQTPRNQGAICLGPSGNLQGGFKFMSLTTMQTIVRRRWDAIPMPDTVIDRVNLLGKDQPELFTFTDRKSRRIGDVELPGVDGDENETPQIADEDATAAEIVDLDIHPEQEAAQELDPNPIERETIEVPTVHDDEAQVIDEPAQVPYVPAPAMQEPIEGPSEIPGVVPEPIEGPGEIPGVRRSTRVRTQTKQAYIPSMSGSSKYAYAVTQLESKGALYPDAHMFFNDSIPQEEPDVVVAVMTQLSLKAGLKSSGVEKPKRQRIQR